MEEVDEEDVVLSDLHMEIAEQVAWFRGRLLLPHLTACCVRLCRTTLLFASRGTRCSCRPR